MTAAPGCIAQLYAPISLKADNRVVDQLGGAGGSIGSSTGISIGTGKGAVG